MDIKKELETGARYRVNITYENGSINVLVFTLEKVYSYLKSANDFVSFEIVRTKTDDLW